MSENFSGADNQQERLINIGWTIGFVDGEGCFSISFIQQPDRSQRKGYRTGFQVSHEFAVTQGERSLDCLQSLQSFFGVGQVIINKRHDNHKEHLYRYVVRKRGELLGVIIPFFQKHRLRTSKQNDFENNKIPLPNILLKTAKLSALLGIDYNVNLFKGWAKDAEHKIFTIGSFQSNIEAAKDPDVSLKSSNPYQSVHHFNNYQERLGIRNTTDVAQSALAAYRTEAYQFVMNTYNQLSFGEVVEGIFDKKRAKVEATLIKIFPDYKDRLKSIESNLRSNNAEDWKSAVVSCRSLLMELADLINPAKPGEDPKNYQNRLMDAISPKIESKTKRELLENLIEEVKLRIEFTIKLTQGSAHKDRPPLEYAEDAVLYTYLVIAEVIDSYERSKAELKPNETT